MKYTRPSKTLKKHQNIEMCIINVQCSVLVSVTDGYIKLTLLLVTIIFYHSSSQKGGTGVYSNKKRTESGSHIELAGRFHHCPCNSKFIGLSQ